MSNNFSNFEGTLSTTLTGAVAINTLTKLGSIMGVSQQSGTNTEIVYRVRGLCKGLPKATGVSDVFTVGLAAYYDETNAKLCVSSTGAASATGATYAGFAAAAAAVGATTMDIVLD